MVDEFTKAALGEAVLVVAQANFKLAGTVVKGDCVKVTAHQDDDLPTVEQAGDSVATCVGVAMKAGDAGDSIPVLMIGIIKVTAGGAGITLGAHVETAASGAVEAGANATKVIGRGLQTIASGATGLVWINCSGGGA